MAQYEFDASFAATFNHPPMRMVFFAWTLIADGPGHGAHIIGLRGTIKYNPLLGLKDCVDPQLICGDGGGAELVSNTQSPFFGVTRIRGDRHG